MTTDHPRPPSTPIEWNFLGRTLQRGSLPLLMGIVNATPDSFSDGGEFLDPARAVDHALELIDAGADVIDVGGESTRPGSLPVDEAEELRRVIPVIEQLASQTAIPISIDTTKSRVAREAVAAGAGIINDISGLTFDPHMVETCAETGAGVVCMHIQGTPQTMQDSPTYRNVVEEIAQFLHERLQHLAEAGVPAERVVLDPGIGFGKTAEHNLALLSNIQRLRALGRPILIGHSRKRFLKRILRRDVEERIAGTIGVSIALAEQGVDLLRIHDVRQVRDALVAWRTVRDRVNDTCDGAGDAGCDAGPTQGG